MATGRRLERPQMEPPAMPDMGGPPVASEFGAFSRPASRGGAGLLRSRLPPWMVLPFGDDAPRQILLVPTSAPASATAPSQRPAPFVPPVLDVGPPIKPADPGEPPCTSPFG